MSAREGIPAAIAAASRAPAWAAVVTQTRGWGLLVRNANGAAVAQLTVVDAEIEATLRVAAGPRLVGDRSAVASVIAERKQRPLPAFPAAWQLAHLVHNPSPPSASAAREAQAAREHVSVRVIFAPPVLPTRRRWLHVLRSAPGILALERLVEVEHVGEILPRVARLADEQLQLDQREND